MPNFEATPGWPPVANPNPRPFDAIARQKAAADLARLDHLAALDDGIRFAEAQRATHRAQLAEAERTLDRLRTAKRDALDGRFVLLPAGDLPVAVQRNPSLRFWLQRLVRRRRPAAYQGPEVDE